MLVVNRSLGVDLDEFEDHGQCLVFLNDTADELMIALKRVVDPGHILTRLVILRRAGRRDALAARLRRDRKIEDDVRPVQRRVNVEQPIQLQAASGITRQRREEKSVGHDHLALDQRGNDFVLQTMAEIGGMQQAEFFLIDGAGIFAGLDDGLDQLR